MRRELSLVGASLVVYACALVLGSLVICETGHASEVMGDWTKQGNAMSVSNDAEGEQIGDTLNPDPQLRPGFHRENRENEHSDQTMQRSASTNAQFAGLRPA